MKRVDWSTRIAPSKRASRPTISHANDVFDAANEGAGDKHGWLWYKVNLTIVNALSENGFDHSDEIVRAVSMLTARTVMDKINPQSQPTTAAPSAEPQGEVG